MDFTEKPDYARVVDICTKDSRGNWPRPVCSRSSPRSPSASRFGIGPLAGYLVGAIGADVLSRCSWRTRAARGTTRRRWSRTACYGGKGTEAHAVTVIGDTVGDPSNDTAGP